MSVILLSLCLSGGAQGVGGAALVRDYGVKLCGREFIRAVIFTCGGSRWRRTGGGGKRGARLKAAWESLFFISLIKKNLIEFTAYYDLLFK